MKNKNLNTEQTEINADRVNGQIDLRVIPPTYENENLILYMADNRDILHSLPPVHLIVTDPPYQGHFGKGGGAFGNRKYFTDVKEGVGSDLTFEIKEYLEILKPVCKPFNGYFWTSQKLVKDYIEFAVANRFSYDILVWSKTNPVPTKNNKYLPDLEYCIYIRESGAVFNNDLKFELYKKLYITQVNKSKYGHPTEKPVEVIYPSILVSSKEGETVLDPFMGSGTTLEAAVKLGRKAVGIEVNQTYFNIARRRLSQTDLFVKTNEAV